MTDRNELLSDLTQFENALADTYAAIGKVKQSLTETMSENACLRLENDRLRERLAELEKNEPVKSPAVASSLMKVYDEGFHVCHEYYGKVLEDGETCLLCQEVLFR
ncbi:MAG: initiation control protein YabA [Streptococcaceae bacterium]|jgi:regulator of replication initiation timing|nr:initiation control protein YabA [Streptococcaceae bacterium]